jgi:superfamily II DNA or RNA helicase
MTEQISLDLPSHRKLPVVDIIKMILDRGELSKDDIRLLWDVSEEDYEVLKGRLSKEKLIEPGPKGKGGFVARFNKRPKSTTEELESKRVEFETPSEEAAAERLRELLSHQDFEDLLGGPLVYTIRKARQALTGEDRRGSKAELAAALLTKLGIDLFADTNVRELVAKRAKVPYPRRWHPGKGAALGFVTSTAFPTDYAGIPAEETPPDFEYLEGRIDLAALQDFQVEVQRKLREVINAPSGRAIVTLPTGAGKTRVAVDTIRDWLSARYAESRTGHGNVVLWLAHTDELCEQAYACFREVWQASSAVCPLLLFRFWGGYTRDLQKHGETLTALDQQPTVLVSTPHRLVNLIEGSVAGGKEIVETLLRVAGLVVVDEAHRAAAPSYRRIIQSFASAPASPSIVGLTATPFRQEYAPNDPIAGTRELRELFNRIIEPIETLGEDPREALQSRGYLAQPLFSEIKTKTQLKTPSGIDVDNPTESDIERIDYALKLRADNSDRRMLVLKEITAICGDSNSLIIYFGPTVQDAECMAFLLRQQGIEAAFVSGGTRDVTRRKIIHDFRAGRVQVLCNCEVLTTGFDAPKVTHVIMARPTVSQVLYEQMVGRGLRGERFGGTATCHVVDLEDNYRVERPQLGYKRFRALWLDR